MADLSMHFWQIPAHAQTTMTKKELKEVLLKYDGSILACGYLWDIKSKHIGVGVYKVTLERQA